MLQSLNPLIELSKGKQLLGLMDQIYNILNQCMLYIAEHQEIENRKAADDRDIIVDKIIKLSSNLPEDSFKTMLLNDLHKIKSGEFFDALLSRFQKSK